MPSYASNEYCTYYAYAYHGYMHMQAHYGCTHYGRLRDHAELLTHESLHQGHLVTEELCESPHRVVLVVEVAHLGSARSNCILAYKLTCTSFQLTSLLAYSLTRLHAYTLTSVLAY